MSPLISLSGALVSLAFTVFVTPFVIRCAWAWQCLDNPDANRKRHRLPTPTMGGIAIVLGGLVGGLYLIGLALATDFAFDGPPVGVWAGALIIIAAGVFDDLRGLDPKAKFVFQVVAAYVLLHSGYAIDLTGFPIFGDDPYRLALYTMPITMVWVVGVINAVNLLDGLDGLASGVTLIAFAGLAVLFGMQGDGGSLALMLVMMGALAGFLVFNFNPASIFMGDSGSLFLGYMLAAYSLDLTAVHADPTVALLIPIVLLGVPIVDTTVAIVRRFLSGKAIFAPDHDHIHHRLREFLSHRATVVTLYLVAAWFALAAYLMAAFPALWSYMLFGVTVATSAVGLHLLGYLRAHALVRGLRYRTLMQKRRQLSAERGEQEEWVPVGDSLRPARRTERAETGDGANTAEPASPRLASVEP